MKKVPELEGLRGFLSTIVVLAHLYPPSVTWVWGTMDMFFCMSGFLIGQLLFNEIGKPNFLRQYAWRRITRIWPAYYVTFGGCLLLAFFSERFMQHPLPWPPGIGNALTLVFLQNTELLLHPGFVDVGRPSDYLPMMGHTWSVALEEQFYVLAPLVCWVITRLRRPFLGAATFTIVCCVLGPILRDYGLNWGVLPARFDGFAIGIFVAKVVDEEKMAGRSFKFMVPIALTFLAGGSLAYALTYSFPPLPKVEFGALALTSPVVIYGVTAISIFSGGLVFLVNRFTGHARIAILRWTPLVGLGRISYSTYLAHIPVIWFSNLALQHWLSLSTLERFVMQLSLCYAGAFALYVLVERPVMQRRSSARQIKMTNSSLEGTPN